MDQSFDAFGNQEHGNGWGGGGAAGDTSFVGTQATGQKQNDYDRVALPVTVATLNNLQTTDEKITFGNYSFSTVRIIAEIVNTIDQTDGANGVRYMIRDYGNQDQSPFTLIRYDGIDGNVNTAFIEGTIIHAVGKIRAFDSYIAVVAFKVEEVKEMGHRDVFPKEARVAELYFTKNVPERLQTGQMSDFVGTMLSPEAPPSNTRSLVPGAPVTPSRNTTMLPPTTPSAMNGSALYMQSQFAGKGANLQQNKILEFLMTKNKEEGLSVQAIKAGIYGDHKFEADIADLAQNGAIYTTIDDNHYAAIIE
jgi:hypothetical protein